MNKTIRATQAECDRARNLFQAYLKDPGKLPVAFRYDGKNYKGLGSAFEVSESSEESPSLVRRTLSAQHESGLHITVEGVLYKAYAAFEWTLYFANKTGAELPMLEEIRAADLIFDGERPRLFTNIGDDPFFGDIYRPVEMDIVPGMELHLQPFGGRATSLGFPYYDLAFGTGGVRIAIGWPGRWFARFEGERDRVHFSAGQYTLSAKLRPGEQIRTPLMAFLLYDGHAYGRSVNLWRRWMIDCNLRRVRGRPFPPAFSVCQTTENAQLITTSEKGERHLVETFEKNGMHVDYNWVDAGWYTKNPTEPLSRWEETGELRCDPQRYPSGFRDLSRYLHSIGTGLLVWFEPERVLKGTESTIEQHKEWLLEATECETPGAGLRTENGWCEANYLANLGNPDYRAWLTEQVDNILTTAGIDVYRQDFNIEPILFWTQNDEPQRKGMLENLYIQGYLAFWDELIRRHPDMMIDSCASGGRRNDLETLRRSVPLCKTDYYHERITDKQAMHLSLFGWYPYFGEWPQNPADQPANRADCYSIQSSFAPFHNQGWNVDAKEFDIEKVREYTLPWWNIREYYAADYYPLTPWNRDEEQWIGWEFFDADRDAGFIQLFRRENCPQETKTVRLYGLDAGASYRIEVSTGGSVILNGGTLMDDGYEAHIPSTRGCLIAYIKKV